MGRLMVQLSEEEQQEIKDMLEDGISCAEIARTIGRSQATVQRYRKAFGYPPVYSAQTNELKQAADKQLYKWLLKNWHFKVENPKPKPKREVHFHTPYNFERFRREDK